ncbi:HIG1 domain family member 1A, mitochondrial-like [Drosophila gunungcola]|uniref:HIG1 domain family member 1A, mitochondrial n=1 Tax=Drosophila elegans TaxID=30023 RepID=UPI0007E770BC|nr:HIG1 domain family member 1A, mitochondrial [Drosophila elegans]XP_052848317.1 HIG1 domain family member 1A, mitochondrial-like [Drosophila gunungcola]
MSSKSLFDSEEDAAQANKLSRKAKESPFMLVGIGGFLAAGLIGAYKYRTRGTMSTSVFLMQLRVAAQGTVVGCLTIGLAYSMAKEYLFDKAPKENAKSLTN